MTTRRRKMPVGRWLQPCPDCAATWAGTELQHEATCPLSMAIEDICDRDREYFEQHPDEWYFTRPITRAELQTLEHIDPAGAALGADHVHVIYRPPWGRVRQFCNHREFASMALDTDEAS